MPPRDLYHEAAKSALAKEGWTITHDPYTITFGRRRVFVDLGAERMLGAQRGEEKIAVEVKSFLGPSELRDIEQAVGPFVLYQALPEEYEPERLFFLAVPTFASVATLEEAIPSSVLARMDVRYFAFDPEQETIARWRR